MLKLILNFLTSGVIEDVGEQLNKAYEAKLKAETDEKKLETDIVITQLERQQELLLAEQKRMLTSWIRPAVALPVVIFIWKIVVWDSTLGLGTTSDPGEFVRWIVVTVVAAYFVTRPFEKRK